MKHTEQAGSGAPRLAVMPGLVRLENTQEYPFNNSRQTVALEREMPDTGYTVLTELAAAGGEVGEICVSGKAVNGFQLAYTGSAPWAEFRCVIVGGAQ